MGAKKVQHAAGEKQAAKPEGTTWLLRLSDLDGRTKALKHTLELKQYPAATAKDGD